MRNAADLAEVLEDPARFDLDEINHALNDPYLRLHGSRLDPRLAELLNRLHYTLIGDDLVSRLMSLTQRRSEMSPAEKAAALRPLLRFLDPVGVDGLPLTSAGYLKPDDVRALAAVIPAMADWIGTANRESQTYPVLWFRESAQKLALVRRYRGRLLLTKAGASVRGNPDALWRHIASRLPIGKAGSLDLSAGLLGLSFAASTPADHLPLEHIAQALNELGWRHSDGSLVTADDAHWATQDTIRVLDNITTGPRPRRWSERHPFGGAAAELARNSIFDR